MLRVACARPACGAGDAATAGDRRSGNGRSGDRGTSLSLVTVDGAAGSSGGKKSPAQSQVVDLFGRIKQEKIVCAIIN